MAVKTVELEGRDRTSNCRPDGSNLLLMSMCGLQEMKILHQNLCFNGLLMVRFLKISVLYCSVVQDLQCHYSDEHLFQYFSLLIQMLTVSATTVYQQTLFITFVYFTQAHIIIIIIIIICVANKRVSFPKRYKMSIFCQLFKHYTFVGVSLLSKLFFKQRFGS